MLLVLSTLVDWTRRTSGDTAQTQTQVLSSDGTGLLTLNATGTITVYKVLSGVVTLDPSTYTIQSNLLIVTPPPAQGVKVSVVFSSTRYADDDILGYLTDAAQAINGSLKYGFVIDLVAQTVADGFDPSSGIALTQLNNVAGTNRPEIDQLIVYGAGLGIYADKANTAADNAIKIKDGDTSIDTSATAGASEKAIQRLVNQYKSALQKVLSEGFMGGAVDMECNPVRFPWFDWISLYY